MSLMTIVLVLFSYEAGSKILEENLKNWEIDPVPFIKQPKTDA